MSTESRRKLAKSVELAETFGASRSKIDKIARGRKLTAIVDVEITLYQVCMECQREDRIGSDEYTWTVDLKDVRANMQTRLSQVRREVGATGMVLAVGSPSSWRKNLDPEYKAHRRLKKPLGYLAAVDWLREEYDVRERKWLEADDVIGLLHTDPRRPLGDTVVVSSDKDMRTLPGRLYNPCVPNPAIENISQFEADVNHLVLALAGDAADGYKGAKGVGEVRAREALALPASFGPKSMPDVIAAAIELFRKSGHDDAYALTQLRLARVLRHGEFDEKLGQVVLWTPPGTVEIRVEEPARARAARGGREGGSDARPRRLVRRAGAGARRGKAPRGKARRKD